MYLSPVKLHYRTPVQSSTMDTHDCGTAKTPGRTNRKSKNCSIVIMNSTVQAHQIGAESRGATSFELSTFNNSVLSLKQVTDTPAKVFARLKAKVQQLNSEEHRKESAKSVQLGGGVLLSRNMQQQQPPVVDASSEGQNTYVLTLSPPECTSQNSEDPQMTSHLDTEGQKFGLVHR